MPAVRPPRQSGQGADGRPASLAARVGRPARSAVAGLAVLLGSGAGFGLVMPAWAQAERATATGSAASDERGAAVPTDPTNAANAAEAGSAANALDPDDPNADLLRTIRGGDTLGDLARRELDTPERWRDVARYNDIANPRRIPPGTVVRIKRAWLKNQRVEARIEAVGGKALVDGRLAQPGAVVGEGADFETRGEETVVLSLPDGTQLRIAPDSRVRLERLRAYHSDRAIEALIRLEHGGVEPESPPRRARPLEIRTPAGNAAVRGTTFRVRAEQQDGFIEVLSGAVAADSQAGDATIDASKGAVVSPVKPPLVEALLPAPYLATQWPLPLRMTHFELDVPPVPGAAGYRIEVARDPAFVDLLLAAVVNEPKFDLTTERDGPLHLRIRGISPAGIEGYDAVATIRVAARPVPPTLASAAEPPDPLEGPVRLAWTVAPGVVEKFRVQLAADPSFDRLLGETVVDGNSATLDLPPTATPTTRYWRVAAIDPATDHQGPYSAPQPLPQRAPAVIEQAEPVPVWRDSSGNPVRSRFGGQVLPGH